MCTRASYIKKAYTKNPASFHWCYVGHCTWRKGSCADVAHLKNMHAFSNDNFQMYFNRFPSSVIVGVMYNGRAQKEGGRFSVHKK